MKRTIDIMLSCIGLLAASPVLLAFMFLIWLQDRRSPLYITDRVGTNERIFRMVKLRSMTFNADKSGVDSTSADDHRITKIGHLVRRIKLDELMQLWNVLTGDMSLVGPRPNIPRETALYTKAEKHLLSVRPGITDISSIVFSDEGEILRGKPDPDIAYHQLIRPGKGHLGLLYIDNQSIWLDLKIIALTALAVFSRRAALRGVGEILDALNASDELIELARRRSELIPMPPPGSDIITTSRDGSF